MRVFVTGFTGRNRGVIRIALVIHTTKLRVLPAVPGGNNPLPSINQMFVPPSGPAPTVVQQQPNPNVINLQNLDPRSHTLLPPPHGTKPAPPGMVNKVILLPTSEPNKFMQVTVAVPANQQSEIVIKLVNDQPATHQPTQEEQNLFQV